MVLAPALSRFIHLHPTTTRGRKRLVIHRHAGKADDSFAPPFQLALLSIPLDGFFLRLLYSPPYHNYGNNCSSIDKGLVWSGLVWSSLGENRGASESTVTNVAFGLFNPPPTHFAWRGVGRRFHPPHAAT
jgi:hypothetical protein